jgi:hypothetical protein
MASSIAIKNALKMLPKNKPNKNSNTQHEKRRYQRVDKNVAIKLADKDVDFVTETINLSCIGAYCKIDTYLPILTKLKITLLLPHSSRSKGAKHVICEGTIVRIERVTGTVEQNTFNIAIYFSHIAKGDMKLIDTYVKNNLSGSIS